MNIETVGPLLFGRNWPIAFARMLGVTNMTIWRWRAKDKRIPDIKNYHAQVRMAARQRLNDLENARTLSPHDKAKVIWLLGYQEDLADYVGVTAGHLRKKEYDWDEWAQEIEQARQEALEALRSA